MDLSYGKKKINKTQGKKKLGDDVVKELREQVPVKSRFLEMFKFGEDKILSSLT